MNEDKLIEPLLPGSTSKMVIPKRKLTKLLKVGGVVCVVTALAILLTALATGRRISTFILEINSGGSSSLVLDNVKFSKDSKTIIFTDHDLKQDYLKMDFEYKLKNVEKKVSELCDKDHQNDDSDVVVELTSKCYQLNLEFENSLYATVYETDLDRTQCHSVHWYTSNKSSEITNCFTMEDNWYGGGGLSVQRWPLNRVSVPLQPHITQKYKSNPNKEDVSFDSFIEPYFVSAMGASILVDRYLPLFISMNYQNDKKICFTTSFKKPYASTDSKEKLILKYLVCKERMAKSMHEHLLRTSKIHFFHRSPESSILKKPIWSTRGLNTADINETKVLHFVTNIKNNKLPFSHLFIDGNYSKFPGVFYFDERKFPHSHQVIQELNPPGEEKFPVGTEVHPHTSSQEAKLFAVQYKNNTPGKVDLDRSYFLDVTNEDSLKWYKSKLTELTEQISVNGFRFSGGYAMDLINGVDQSFLITNKTLRNPNFFTMKFAEVASELKETFLVDSGYDSQRYTFVADAGPMMPSWDHKKGIKSIIPTVLTYGIMGYPFGLMGPVGGVNFEVDTVSGLLKPPDKDLYIRWLQLATYLPVMELSVGPWVYGQEVVNYTQTLLKFRINDLWPNLLSSAVEEAVKFGTPIARPLWWHAPGDKIAQFIDCEFFLGNSLLVAPVLYDEARFRDVYLPEGNWWRDQLRGQLYKGGQWLRRYNVGLYEIATFKRDSDPSSL